jgi:ornithine cyclodeaminase
MSVPVYARDEIVAVLEQIPIADVFAALRRGFVAYSNGTASVPPVGHIAFDNPPGSVHIKSGYIKGDPVFVIKIADAFPRNVEQGLSTVDGMMVAVNARTGAFEAVLHDESYLTNFRTAATGAMVAQLLASKTIRAIGIVGTGIQAHMQLDLLRYVTPCRTAFVWGRNRERAAAFHVDGFSVTPVEDVAQLARRCNLIVTTTSATEPLLFAKDVQPGTHITAMGSDMPGKQELDPQLLAKAAICAVDSRSQCFDHGDAHYAVRDNLVPREHFVELGEIIADPSRGRTSEEDITIADLTGLAVQDIAITRLVWERLRAWEVTT